MIIGVPKERKTLEKRVSLTPDGAHELIKRGHKVLIETGAGEGSLLPDESYAKVGCEVVSSLEEVWTRSELVVKVKEPHEDEYRFFREGLAVFDYLHLASMPDLAKRMVESGITGIAFELVQTPDGRHPLLDPMSEVAGKLAVLNGAYFLLSQNGGRGVLLAGTTTIPARKVVIVGAGKAGTAAVESALGMGARVTVLDINVRKLEAIKLRFGERPRTVFSTSATLARECVKADLLIGAVLIPGAAAPKLITREIIRAMKPGSVYVDISIDQGGCSETIRPTDLKNPVYVEEGVIHYGVCNMPAQTPRTSTFALAAATLPYIVKLADTGIMQALKESEELKNALNTHKGMLTNKAVSEAVGIPYVDADEALKS
ncbi:MAG: alanine dehydrogenase [Candidatus Dadabacteria bacterium]|nr:MAG: alanine dehydrogenase [Candidatus Dadabacteria bacterium]